MKVKVGALIQVNVPGKGLVKIPVTQQMKTMATVVSLVNLLITSYFIWLFQNAYQGIQLGRKGVISLTHQANKQEGVVGPSDGQG